MTEQADFAIQGDFTMRNSFVAAGALVLGALGFTGSAEAVPPLSSHEAAPLLILAEDIEDQEVQHDIYPDLVPLPSQVDTQKATPDAPVVERPKGEANDNVEEEEFKEDGIGAK
jgi:hypothetical protein